MRFQYNALKSDTCKLWLWSNSGNFHYGYFIYKNA
nr:MAG TPA: glycoside hydrolase family protein [Caudoviricetes sp.]